MAEGTPHFDTSAAETYLAGFTDLPEPPVARDRTEEVTGLHLVRAMEKLMRAQVYKDGTHQSNANHSWRLRVMCVSIADAERKDLDEAEVGSMCEGHDMHELFGGDTPIRDQELMTTKEYREAAGRAIFVGKTLLKHPYRRMVTQRYHDGLTPEARLVNGIDKVEPIEFDLENDGATQRCYGDPFPWLVNSQLPKTILDPTAFRIMVERLVEMGKRWPDWKCVPFDGDPEEIVYKKRDELIHHNPDLRPVSDIWLP